MTGSHLESANRGNCAIVLNCENHVGQAVQLREVLGRDFDLFFLRDVTLVSVLAFLATLTIFFISSGFLTSGCLSFTLYISLKRLCLPSPSPPFLDLTSILLGFPEK